MSHHFLFGSRPHYTISRSSQYMYGRKWQGPPCLVSGSEICPFTPTCQMALPTQNLRFHSRDDVKSCSTVRGALQPVILACDLLCTTTAPKPMNIRGNFPTLTKCTYTQFKQVTPARLNCRKFSDTYQTVIKFSFHHMPLY